ncbi:serine hydrolase domain-containing protein [Streptomyces sp. NPDC001279]|uniref:serine hydrolase domain-containing protein n=1 Tax=unclassified Streptomyces TaxID=2593676 RepID=UPI0036CE6622
MGVSVAVVDHGTVTKAALGTTDGSTPVTPDTAFETGSAQKVLTASLLGSLLDAGKIKLTDTVGALWPERTFADPAVAGITVEQLATHTAGLPSFPPDGPQFPVAMAGYLLGGNGYSILHDAVSSLTHLTGFGPKPDTAFSYSNLGYAVLGETLAKVDGRDYPTTLRERVLAPLGMDHTTVRTTPGTPDGATLQFHTAGTPVVPWTNPGWAAVGTGTWTTSADLAANTAPNPPAALALHPCPARRRRRLRGPRRAHRPRLATLESRRYDGQLAQRADQRLPRVRRRHHRPARGGRPHQLHPYPGGEDRLRAVRRRHPRVRRAADPAPRPAGRHRAALGRCPRTRPARRGAAPPRASLARWTGSRPSPCR